MTRHIHDSAQLYVDNRELPYQVTMYTDEHSPVCTIRFGNSFTLNVFDPLMLETFIQALKEFADAAHELHYGPQSQRGSVEEQIDEYYNRSHREAALSEEMAQLQQKLEDCGVEDWTDDDPANYDNPAAADVYVSPSPRQSRVEVANNPIDDPLNW